MMTEHKINLAPNSNAGLPSGAISASERAIAIMAGFDRITATGPFPNSSAEIHAIASSLRQLGSDGIDALLGGLDRLNRVNRVVASANVLRIIGDRDLNEGVSTFSKEQLTEAISTLAELAEMRYGFMCGCTSVFESALSAVKSLVHRESED